METFERYQVIDDNAGGPLLQIRNMVDGSECWAKRSRLKRYDGCWILVSDRQYDLLVATRKRQAAKVAKEKLAREAKVAEPKTEVAA